MARLKHEIIYPDSRKQVSTSELNSLLLSREIKQIGPSRYVFVGQVRTYHAFADLRELLHEMVLPPNLVRHYLEALCVIWTLALERERQYEETPASFEQRLESMGMPAGGFA